eukprot:COSAG02_NODE_4763_length_5010_cov_7.005091_1_plen_58_part_10
MQIFKYVDLFQNFPSFGLVDASELRSFAFWHERRARCAGAGGGHQARGEAKRPSVAIP